MLKLDLKALRDASTMKLRGLAIVAAVAFWAAFYGGYFMGIDSAEYSYGKVCQDLHLADLQVFVTPSTEEELPRFDDIPGIQAYEKRLFSRGTVELQQGGHLSVYVIYGAVPKNEPINRLKILDGRPLSETDPDADIPKVLIDRTLSSEHGVRVGDKLTLTEAGNDRDVQIHGVALSPEFLFPTADPSLQLPAQGSLGIVFSAMTEVTRVFGYPLYNNLSFTFEPGYDPLELEEVVRGRLSGIKTEAFVPQRESFDHKTMSAVFVDGRSFGPVVSTSLILVVFIIVYVNIYRMMEERRRETGVLAAMGSRKRSLILYAVKMNLTYILFGSVIGFGLSFVLNPVFALSVLKQIGFPESEIAFVYLPWLPLKGILYCTILSLLAVVSSAWRILKLTPQEAIRGGPARLKSVPSWLSLLRFSSKGMGEFLSVKYGLRSLARRHNLTILTCISIAFALALSISLNILHTSINGTLQHFYDDDPWNLIVDFRVPLDPEEIGQVLPAGSVDDYEGYLKGLGVIRVGGQKSFGQIIGLPSERRMRRLRVVEGEGFSDNQALEVILNRNLWKKTDLRIGDQVPLETTQGRYTMTLVGVVDEVTIGIEYAYVPIGTAQDLLDQEGKYTGVWAISPSAPGDAKSLLSRIEMISKVTTKKEISTIIDQFMVSLKTGLSSIRVMTMLLAPIFLFTSMGLSLLEKERDFIILRSMGSRKGRVLGILMTEALVVGILAMLLCIPLSLLMGRVMNAMQGAIHYAVETHVQLADFYILFWCSPLFPFVAWIFSRRISRLNIAQALTGRMG